MSDNGPRRRLTLFDSVCIILGVVIGAGIYESTPRVAGLVSSSWTLMAVWGAGGLITLAGALCYVELATALPREGGDFVFLSRAFGRPVGFLFAWTEFWIVRPGSVGIMAFVFARFAHASLSETLLQTGDTDWDFVLYAAGSIVAVTLLNLLGVRAGKTTQNVLTVLKVVGLLGIIGVALLTPTTRVFASSGLGASPPNYALALVLVLFTYGGWNDLSYVAAEVREPNRNILRALLIGVASITAVYLLVNLAFVYALGLAGASSNSAANLAEMRWGGVGRRAIGALVCVSSLGAINGSLFAGSRIYYAVGTEHPRFAWLSQWSGGRDAPVRSLLLQGSAALLWVCAFGSEDGFGRLIAFTSPVFWFFAMLISISVFVLRIREPDLPRPHKIVLFPITPIVFFLSCLFMFCSATNYATTVWQAQWALSGWAPEAFCTLGVIAIGIGIGWALPAHR
ncbi:MAG: amino acid permease [Pirellulales bacterium]|nr:amino acid permease [Pirellulales bacterium]